MGSMMSGLAGRNQLHRNNRIPFENSEMTCDEVLAASSGRLINDWFLEGDMPSVCRHDEIAVAVDPKISRAVKMQLNTARAAPGDN